MKKVLLGLLVLGSLSELVAKRDLIGSTYKGKSRYSSPKTKLRLRFLCEQCGRSKILRFINCKKCGKAITYKDMQLLDQVLDRGIAECGHCNGKIKSPECCGNDMVPL